MSNDVHDVVIPLVEELLSDNDSMDVDSSARRASSTDLHDATLASAVEAFLRSINPNYVQDLRRRLSEALAMLVKVGSNASRVVQSACFVGAARLFDKMHAQKERQILFSTARDEEMFVRFVETLFQQHVDGPETIRQLRADTALSLAKLLQSIGLTQARVSLLSRIIDARAVERSSAVQMRLDCALDLLR
ncbi:MAG: hypothetical protein M1827_003008 [Pycnora praestabilis]|nr:MAG: hypothetical protein M1827_003008 [Pycnora praestabilis]